MKYEKGWIARERLDDCFAWRCVSRLGSRAIQGTKFNNKVSQSV